MTGRDVCRLSRWPLFAFPVPLFVTGSVSAAEILLSAEGTPFLVAWSPDARRLAYGVEQEDDQFQMWVVNADGKAQAEHVGAGAPLCWTHDARQIFAQLALCASPLRYQLLDPETFATGPVLERPGGCLLWMSRSPTGTGYLTVTMHCPPDDVWTAATCDLALADDAGVVQELLVTGVPASNTALPSAVVSPDGRWLAYTRWDYDERASLHLLDLQTKESRVLVRRGKCLSPVWSPDGKQIAFAYSQEGANGDPQLVTVEVQTSARREVGTLRPAAYGWDVLGPLCFAREGEYLICLRGNASREGELDVVARPLNDRLTEYVIAAGCRSASVSPDGRRVALVRQDGLWCASIEWNKLETQAQYGSRLFHEAFAEGVLGTPETRRQAVRELGRVGGEQAQKALVRATQSDHPLREDRGSQRQELPPAARASAPRSDCHRRPARPGSYGMVPRRRTSAHDAGLVSAPRGVQPTPLRGRWKKSMGGVEPGDLRHRALTKRPRCGVLAEL